MTEFPEPMLNHQLQVKRGTPTQGLVGERLSDEVQDGRAEWLEQQHQRDLETLDRIERQREEDGP